MWRTTGVGQGNGPRRRWTTPEDDLIRAHAPNYRLLESLLPDRTPVAVRARAGTLGLRRRASSWGSGRVAELEKLRRQGLTVTQILPHFPEHTRRQIEDQLRERQIFISRPPIPVSDPLTNAIRQRAFAVGMTLAELGRRAGTGAYFHFDRPSGASPEKAAAAAKVLGCELVIEWEPLT